MNQEKLLHIASHPSEISADDARELDELTRKFPYFTLPWVLLSRYYSIKNDYRYEDTLHKTSLRISDRAWLYDFIHRSEDAIQQASAAEQILTAAAAVEMPEAPEQLTETAAESGELTTALTAPDMQEEVHISETGEASTESGISEIPAALPETEHTSSAESVPATELISEPSEVNAEEAELVEPIRFSIDTEGLPLVASIIELDNNADASEIARETAHDEDAVFEEIGSFDTGNSTAETAEEQANAEETPEILHISLPALMVMPDTESAETESELMVLPDAEMAEETLREEADDLENSTVDDHSISLPKARTPQFSASAVYNIEDYYPAPDDEQKGPPADFFSWLSQPGFEENQSGDPHEPEEEPKDRKTDLIDRFILNQPGVSRPKGEFFNAAEVAKKSETLPAALVTETLASVYRQQGNFGGAIRIYEALMLKFPEKSAYFAALIEKLKKEHNL